MSVREIVTATLHGLLSSPNYAIGPKVRGGGTRGRRRRPSSQDVRRGDKGGEQASLPAFHTPRRQQRRHCRLGDGSRRRLVLRRRPATASRRRYTGGARGSHLRAASATPQGSAPAPGQEGLAAGPSRGVLYLHLRGSCSSLMTKTPNRRRRLRLVPCHRRSFQSPTRASQERRRSQVTKKRFRGDMEALSSQRMPRRRHRRVPPDPVSCTSPPSLPRSCWFP